MSNIKQNSWQKEWNSAQNALVDCKNEVESRGRRDVQVLRSNQLDAQILDSEINGLLSGQFMKAFAFFKPDLIDKIKPELNAILDLLIFRYSIFEMDTTYGNKLQNLKFVDSKLIPLSIKLKIIYGIITVGGKYLWTRLNSMSILREDWSGHWYTKVWKEKLLLFANVANFIIFLFDGKYVSVLHRLLGLRLVYKTTNVQRQLSFEFMNRQLVWHEFTEFLMFLLPLVSVEKLKNSFSRYFFSPQLVKVPPTVCPICMKDPIDIPYKSTICGHIYCYYCVKQKLMIDSGFPCPRCGELIPNIERYQEFVSE